MAPETRSEPTESAVEGKARAMWDEAESRSDREPYSWDYLLERASTWPGDYAEIVARIRTAARAELRKAAQEQNAPRTVTEWGVRRRNGAYITVAGEEDALRTAAILDNAVPVSRRVTPWVEVAS